MVILLMVMQSYGHDSEPNAQILKFPHHDRTLPRALLTVQRGSMQKVLRRTAVAKSQAKRKARILEEKITKRDWYAARAQQGQILTETFYAARTARNVRRENWELGALSPWQNALEVKETYGTFNPRIMNSPKVPEKLRIKDWFIREGDRVCLVKGREGVKGRIGKVMEVDKETEMIKIENVNIVSGLIGRTCDEMDTVNNL